MPIVILPRSPYLAQPNQVTSTASQSSYSSYDIVSNSTSRDSPEAVQHKSHGPLAWWSGYTPLESWIPPKPGQIWRFKGLPGVEPYLKFKRYKLAAEGLQQEWTKDCSANQDIRYEMYFHEEGDKVTSMLAVIQVLDMVHGPHIAAMAILRLPVHEDAGLDESMDDTPCSPTIDSSASGLEDPMEPMMSGGHEDSQHGGWMQSSDGWAPTMGISGAEEDLYDFGWEEPMDTKPTAPGITLGQEEDPYDCGWEDSMEVQPTTSVMTLRNEEDPYDFGWESQPDDCEVTNPVTSRVTQEDPYDCGWDEPMDPDGVSPVADPDDPYDFGWDDIDDGHPNTISGQNAAAGNDLDVVDLTSSSGSCTQKREPSEVPLIIDGPDVIDLTSDAGSSSGRPSKHNAFVEAGQSMHRAIQRLNSLGTDHLMANQLPAATFMANQRLLGAYAEAQDRTTELGNDLVAIYRLLDIHCCIMDPLDAMIANLEEDDQET
ncbi:hypothetical protein F4604DRAFT_1927279 [Suillus subluteus]|nr:hypothetical protein F4604DRAFT_1927279 [Suillus subluteus]